MKKIFAAALAVLMLCGCSSTSNETSSTEETVSETAVNETVSETTVSETTGETGLAANASDSSLKDVFEEIKSSVELPVMIELNDNLLPRYYGLSADVVSDYAGGVDSSGIGQDEIVLMKAADESQVETIREALQTRYDSKLAQQENYNPQEAEKISKCEVQTNGLYVTLIISNDAAAITEIVNSHID